MTKKTHYAQVGLGARSLLYSRAVGETYSNRCKMVGFCDVNEGRLQDRLNSEPFKSQSVPGYCADAFDQMICETRPHVIIVTTKDSEHERYICRAMELGCEVITEKPMTISAEKCQRIIDTQKETGKQCRVTFNYRYSPPRIQVKELLMAGVIGNILSVDFHWMLDTYHGADYFRRWHSRKKNSGGLMVHKATHHFDLVNWWLSAVPVSVFARGHRRFATPQTAERLGLINRTNRCHTCPESEHCAFALDLTAKDSLKQMYLNNEQYDGYYRDGCIFATDIDIEDSVNVVADYNNGVKLAYSLNVFCGWEGYQIAFNGTSGRLEHTCQESVYISGDGTIPGSLKPENTRTRIYPIRDQPYEVELWQATGGHGGGDVALLEDIFGLGQPDKYLRAADHWSGAYAMLCGVAANESMRTDQHIHINDLVSGLQFPDFPPMPTDDEPMPMPNKRGPA